MTLLPAYGSAGFTPSAPVVKLGADSTTFELNGLALEDIDSPVGPITVIVPATGTYLVLYQAQILCDNADAAVETAIGLKIDSTPVALSEVNAYRAESGSSMGDERMGVSGSMTLALVKDEVVEMQAYASANTGVTQVASNVFGRTKLEIIHLSN